MKRTIIIFTDLDGTLLDHDTYSYEAAEPCLEYLRVNNIPLIFTSSKTAIEIESLCREANFLHPFIAENGGLLCTPENYFTLESENKNKYIKSILGIHRKEINKLLLPLKTSFKFLTFNEMSTNKLIECTGLSQQQAIFANQRDTTEPLLWQDEQDKLTSFQEILNQHNLTLVSGGRFHHVMGIQDKATTMLKLIEQFKNYLGHNITSIALGDSPNDMKMLETADHSILVPNPNAPKLCDTNRVNLVHAQHSGPRGWNESLLTLLKEISK